MLFTSLGENLKYTDSLQLDSAFSLMHTQYGKTPIFNGEPAVDVFPKMNERILEKPERINDFINEARSFNGTASDRVKENEKINLWKQYWMEYVNAFDAMTSSLPESIATIYIGRRAIELSFKYLLRLKRPEIERTHDLFKLYNAFDAEYAISDEYLNDVDMFCHRYMKTTEGGNVEYFHFPQYRGNSYFDGIKLDIKWLSYSLALVILKLMHVAELEEYECPPNVPAVTARTALLHDSE